MERMEKLYDREEVMEKGSRKHFSEAPAELAAQSERDAEQVAKP